MPLFGFEASTVFSRTGNCFTWNLELLLKLSTSETGSPCVSRSRSPLSSFRRWVETSGMMEICTVWKYGFGLPHQLSLRVRTYSLPTSNFEMEYGPVPAECAFSQFLARSPPSSCAATTAVATALRPCG